MATTTDLISKINEKYGKMSKGQKLLSNYIIDNYDKAVFLTAAKLGDIIGVSESTVVRFASFIGYKGYPEFQQALEDMHPANVFIDMVTKILWKVLMRLPFIMQLRLCLKLEESTL